METPPKKENLERCNFLILETIVVMSLLLPVTVIMSQTDPSPRVLCSSVHIKRVKLFFYMSVHVGNVLRVAHARARETRPAPHTRQSVL